jgi:tetratricopeptide (TPR) repeat protein
MRNYITLFLALVFFTGCTHEAVKTTAITDQSAKSNTRYDYLLAEAMRQKYVGDLAEAAGIFEKCIEIDDTRAVPFFELAQIYAAIGSEGKSLEYASKAANLEPGNYWYQLACGSLFTQYNMKDSALVYFTRALKADSNAMEVNTILAGLYAEKGDAEKADSLFRLLDEEGALNDDMFLIMITGLIENGNMEEAARRTEKLIEQQPAESRYKALLADIYFEYGRKEESDSIYREIIEKDPDNIESQMLYLMNLVYKKEYSGISGFLNTVFESELVERERKISLAGRLLQDTAYIKDNTGSLGESLIILERKYPQDEEIMSLRASMYETAGKTDEAILRYEEIVKTVKPAFYSSERLVLLYAEKKEYDKLYGFAAAYSAENNRSILGKVYYAIAAMELQHYDVADAELQKALILAGNNNELKVQVLTMLGDLRYRMKDFENTYSYYEEALALAPNEVLVLNNYAYFLAEGNKDLTKALKMAEEVMKTDGDNKTYIDTYAWVLYKLGKKKKAYKEMLRIFQKQEERDPEILEHMGFILKSMGKCTEAVGYWEEALIKDKAKSYLEKEIEACGRLSE